MEPNPQGDTVNRKPTDQEIFSPDLGEKIDHVGPYWPPWWFWLFWISSCVICGVGLWSFVPRRFWYMEMLGIVPGSAYLLFVLLDHFDPKYKEYKERVGAIMREDVLARRQDLKHEPYKTNENLTPIAKTDEDRKYPSL